MAARKAIELTVDGHSVRLSSPDKVYFSDRGETKMDLVSYFLAVGDGVMRALRDRPVTLQRFPGGPKGKRFYQKRVPEKRPDWLSAVEVRFPSARPGSLLCPQDMAHIVWAVNLGGFEIHPWPVTRANLDHPTEMRIDLDPQPGADFDMVRAAAHEARALLQEVGLSAFPKLSGSKGVHLHVPIVTEWEFVAVRNACLAFARELERRVPNLITAAWWKEERGERVFVDFNQNLRDKTIVGAYAVRPRTNAPVACPIEWSELDAADQRDFTIATVPARFSERGDPMAAMDDHPPGRLDGLLQWAERDSKNGILDAPWPPHYPKQPGEPPRVQPSRARKQTNDDNG